MRTIILDSSVYISSLNIADKLNKTTREFLVQLTKEQDVFIIVPVLIMLEVANILKKSVKEIEAIFAGGKIIELNLELTEGLIPFFKSLKLKTSDAVIAGCANIHKAELVSWDKKLVKEAKTIAKAYTPREFLNALEK